MNPDRNIDWRVIAFGELDAATLYEILTLRAEVFVVEQNCPYLDPDGKDRIAMHVLGYVAGDLAAYSRVFRAGDYHEHASIGRLVVSPQHRGTRLGHELTERSISTIESLWGPQIITISAQQHLEKFYNAHGFASETEPYLEDGIPHIRMRRS